MKVIRSKFQHLAYQTYDKLDDKNKCFTIKFQRLKILKYT